MITKELLEADLKKAMLQGQKRRISTLRLLISAMKYRQIELGKPLDPGEIQAVINSGIKKRRESIAEFEKGGRLELAQAEREEMEILQSYVPPQLSEGEIHALIEEAVRETGAGNLKDLGKVMKWIMPKLSGRADGKVVGEMVKKRLN